jgi:hypothetical protein
MPKRAPQDWETLERELHAAGVSEAEIEAGARRLLAEARGHQLAEARSISGRYQIADRRQPGSAAKDDPAAGLRL